MSEGKVGLEHLDVKAQKSMAELQLLPDEQILRIWEGDGFFLGSNPIAKLMAQLVRLGVFLTCGHLRVYVVFTNMRIIVASSTAAYCGAAGNRTIKTLALSSLLEATVARSTSCCCFHARTIHFQTRTEEFGVAVKKFKDEDLRDFLDFLGRVMVNNSRNA